MSDQVSFDEEAGTQFVTNLQRLHSTFEQSAGLSQLELDLSKYLAPGDLLLNRYLDEVESDFSFVADVVERFTGTQPQLSVLAFTDEMNSELAELDERIANWNGTDNDPILDDLVRRRNVLLAQMEDAEVVPVWDQQSGAETLLGWMEETGSEGFTYDEFAALADDPTVPAHVRDAAALFAGEPVMISNLRHTGWLAGSSEGVTIESMELFVMTQEASRELGDRSTYNAFDSALNGELDNKISWDDVHLVADDPNADPEVRKLAQLLEDNPAIFDMLRTGETASPNEQYIPPNHDGMISFGDVAATAVNMQAFEDRPEVAADFVLGLESTNDHRDASGNFLHIQWFSDSGVRNLASEALSTAPLLSDQVALVERLPESPGGIRNLAITEYYRRMGEDINLILNPDGNGGALTVDSQGSTGTNWFMQGTFASASVRPVLVEDSGYSVVGAGWAARQSMADGNQLLFGSLAPAAAAFIETFPPGTEPTQADIEEFLDGERANGVPLFDEGDRQLRDAFLLMLDASTDSDPVTRQQTAFQASLLIGVHEQALVDPFVDRALDQGWDDGFRVLGDIFDPDESIATGQIDPNLGGYQFDADKPLPVPHSHPDNVIGQDLTTTLNPTLATTANIGGLTYDLSGSGDGDVDLAPLAGWDDVPDHWELNSMIIDPAEWYDEFGSFETGGTWGFGGEQTSGSTNGVPLQGYDNLPGAAVDDWKEYPDRMWTITNSFQQTHTLGSMEGTPDALDEADLSFLPGHN